MAQSTQPGPPDLESYHRSLSDELFALKDRIRHLVTHWPTDGEHKEAALRTVLRRQLPDSFHVGRGFVVTPTTASTQIDVMVIDGRIPALFRDGDLFIVSPDAVCALLEVKTSLATIADVAEAVTKLATAAELCRDARPDGMWTGLFIYGGDSKDTDHRRVLKGLQQGTSNNESALNCVAAGADLFARWWKAEDDPSPQDNFPGRPLWRSYQIEKLAPAYFLGNLIAHVSAQHAAKNQQLWFPLATANGKENYGRFEISLQDLEPHKLA